MILRLLSLKATPKIITCSFIFLFSLVSLIVILVPESDYTKTDINRTVDLNAFMTGASIVRDGKVKEIYNQELQKKYEYAFFTSNENLTGLLAFRALPITAYLYLPLLYLSPIPAFWIQASLSMICLFFSLWIINKSFRINTNVFWLCTTTILFFLPIFNVLRNGQLSIFLLLILCLSIYYSKKTKISAIRGFAGIIAFKNQLTCNCSLYIFP